MDDPGPRFNVAPTDDALVVVQREDRRAMTAYRWGLVPHWAKDLKTGSRMFNARAETLTTSPAFRDAFKRRRCLVPVDSFYEWKREGTVRQPYNVITSGRATARPRRAVGRLARSRQRPEAPFGTDLHHRHHGAERGARRPARPDAGRSSPTMPGIAGWTRPAPIPAKLLALLQPTDDIALRVYAVNRDVNDVRRDGPELVEPLIAAPPPGAPGPRPRPRRRSVRRMRRLDPGPGPPPRHTRQGALRSRFHHPVRR